MYPIVYPEGTLTKHQNMHQEQIKALHVLLLIPFEMWIVPGYFPSTLSRAKLCDHSEISLVSWQVCCKAACQMSEQWEYANTETCSVKT